MRQVYIDARLLAESAKAKTSLEELRKRQAKLAADLAGVHDRMRADRDLDRLLRRQYAAYDKVSGAYSLVIDDREHERAMSACTGPPNYAQPRDPLVEFEFFDKWMECSEGLKNFWPSFIHRQEQLGFDPNADTFQSAQSCLASAEDLFWGRGAKAH